MPPDAFTGPDNTRCHQMLSQGPIPPDANKCFHRARYHQLPDCNAFTGPHNTRSQTAMLSQGPIPPDTILQCFHRALYHQMTPDAFTGPDTTRCRLQCFHRSPYHQMPPDVTQYHQIPDCNAFTGPDTTRCHTAMLSQVPIPPDATRCNPIPPDARLQCFHMARYHQIPDCNAFTGPDTTRCQTAMLSQVPIPPDATRCNPIPPDARLQCFHRTRYHQMTDCNAFKGPDTAR